MFRYCSEEKPFQVSTRSFHKKCGYCKSAKVAVGREGVSPQGFCIDAFYAVYPYLLALLYDAKFDFRSGAKALVIRCPNSASPSFIKVSFKRKKLKPLLNILEKTFRALGSPKDAIDKIMTAEVLHENKDCLMPAGSGFALRIPDIRQLCPASFFSLYPFLYAHKKDPGAGLPQMSFSCPDPKTCVTYEVDTSAVALAKEATPSVGLCCFEGGAIAYKLTATTACGPSCPTQGNNEKEVALDKILPAGLCSTLLNVAVPYILTLRQGGYFKWRMDSHTVEAQCPHPLAPVVFEVKRDGRDRQKISLLIKKAHPSCPRCHREGEVFELDPSGQLCLHLFARLFPYLLLLERARKTDKTLEGFDLECPWHEGASYRLTHSPRIKG